MSPSRRPYPAFATSMRTIFDILCRRNLSKNKTVSSHNDIKFTVAGTGFVYLSTFIAHGGIIGLHSHDQLTAWLGKYAKKEEVQDEVADWSEEGDARGAGRGGGGVGGRTTSHVATQREERHFLEIRNSELDHIKPKWDASRAAQPARLLQRAAERYSSALNVLVAGSLSEMRFVSKQSHVQITRKQTDLPLHARHVQRCSHGILKSQWCAAMPTELARLRKSYPSIECCCEGHGLSTVQRACEAKHPWYTALDTVVKDQAAIRAIEMMDQCRGDPSDDNRFKTALVEAGVPQENAAFIVTALRNVAVLDRRRVVLKILLIQLTGNTDAVSGQQLLSELPYRGPGTRPLAN